MLRFLLTTLFFPLVAAVAALGAVTPATAPPMTSPADLWRGYDPEALPLEVEVRRTWSEEGCTYQALTFTGELAGGARTRVFALQGAPERGKRLPGVLHIHGGGQTASLEWVKYWARRGYVAVSFDFCGPWEKRTEFTDWGPIAHANMAQANGGFQVHPTPRESSWYHWAVAGRRALTLLARHPQVNPKRLGIFGISVGGTLTWLLAASDARIRAAAPIYGCGYNHDDRDIRWGLPPLSPDLRIYKQVLSPEAHAPYVTCPLLFLSATNDIHGPMDYAYDTLGAARGPVWQAFTPRTNHHVEPEQGRDLAHWMDWQLRGEKAFPHSPRVRLKLDAEGVPHARVTAERREEVRKVEIYYGLGDRMPQARYWRFATSVREDQVWQADAPVMNPWEPLVAFANVTYADGVCLSSNLARAIPGQLGKARATLTPSLEWTQGRDGLEYWFFTSGYTDPTRDDTYLSIERTADPPALTLNPKLFGDSMNFSISTHLVGDPQFIGPPNATLSFECRGGFTSEGMTVTAYLHDWSPLARTFTATVLPAELSTDWKRVMLPAARFTDAGGQTLAGWAEVQRIAVKGGTARSAPPLFRKFRWMLPGR